MSTFLTHGPFAGRIVNRLGFGTMRLTGAGIWGQPNNEVDAIGALRAAVDAGAQHIDTADAYGPHIAEEIIARALHPYPKDIVIATKGGFTRQGPNRWSVCGVPAYLRQCVELSLRRLRLDSIDLYYLHRIDPNVPLADQVGTLADLVSEGKIRHIGLSKVSVAQAEAAAKLAPIAAIQNRFNWINKSEESDMVRWCETYQTPFIPYAPLAVGACVTSAPDLLRLSKQIEVEPAVFALAWLLQYSPIMFPIPGTSNIKHALQNSTAIELARSLEFRGFVKECGRNLG